MTEKYETLFTTATINTFIVHQYPQLCDIFKDSSRVFPQEQYTMCSGRVHIQCFSNTSVKWKFKNRDLPLKFQHRKNSISGVNLKVTFGGKYQCYGKTENGED